MNIKRNITFALKTGSAISRHGKWPLLVGFLIIDIFSVFSQAVCPFGDKLAEQLQSLVKNNAPELIYIQPSKGIYETCEDLWFKAYLLDAQYFTPSLLSKTLYLQLIHEDTWKIVWQEKYPVENGFSQGHVFLPDSLPEGNYLLEGFSQYSFLANGEEMKAVRRVEIKKQVKPQALIDLAAKSQTETKYPIQFTTFPEGGHLVSGIPGKLAFKAINVKGLSVDAAGTLLEDAVPLVKFKSTHAGMGSLVFTPEAGKQYSIRLSDPDTVIYLPKVMPEGITLQLTGRKKDYLEFLVLQSPSLPQRSICLRAQVRGGWFTAWQRPL
ncbi:hypothetical protein [Paludibacter sp.]|uniref:hypothetical protein n=1 Tax=Paludibacter sp. TaxID=1898105 RepID=UPI0013558E61|nr:hypothetical protein [Paludibacter sp.]MTK52152.1 hypothetical protein [Paludibacter sp.]